MKKNKVKGIEYKDSMCSLINLKEPWFNSLNEVWDKEIEWRISKLKLIGGHKHVK